MRVCLCACVFGCAAVHAGVRACVRVDESHQQQLDAHHNCDYALCVEREPKGKHSVDVKAQVCMCDVLCVRCFFFGEGLF